MKLILMILTVIVLCMIFYFAGESNGISLRSEHIQVIQERQERLNNNQITLNNKIVEMQKIIVDECN
jgi:hypothetical protein